MRFPLIQNNQGRSISYMRWTRNYIEWISLTLDCSSDIRFLPGFIAPAIFRQTRCKLLDSLKVDRRAISFVIIGNEPPQQCHCFGLFSSLRTRLLNTTITKRVFFIAPHISNSCHHFYAFRILNRLVLLGDFVRSQTTYCRPKSRF